MLSPADIQPDWPPSSRLLDCLIVVDWDMGPLVEYLRASARRRLIDGGSRLYVRSSSSSSSRYRIRCCRCVA